MVDIIKAFITGGIICVIAQILVDFTKITPARIMVIYVVAGVILGLFGIYPLIVEFGGAGATIPLSGFGSVLAKGVMEDVDKEGLFGVITGGVKAAAAGIASAITFGYIMAIVSKPRLKS
jgi:stage V sporulation protein AE